MIAAFHVADEVEIHHFKQRRGIARERVALVFFFANRKQTNARTLHFEHVARIDLAHQAEVRQHLRLAIDVGADIDNDDGRAFDRWEKRR